LRNFCSLTIIRQNPRKSRKPFLARKRAMMTRKPRARALLFSKLLPVVVLIVLASCLIPSDFPSSISNSIGCQCFLGMCLTPFLLETEDLIRVLDVFLLVGGHDDLNVELLADLLEQVHQQATLLD